MCEITGIYNFKTKGKVEWRVIEEMTELLSHRGPDSQGIYIDQKNYLGFGHRRLSLIDPARGHQPMSDNEGKFTSYSTEKFIIFLNLKRSYRKKTIVSKQIPIRKLSFIFINNN